MFAAMTSVPAWARQEPAAAAAESKPTTRLGAGEPTPDMAVETAKRKARETGKRVEIPSKRSENATVYANPDGETLRMELRSQPFRMKKEDGTGFTPIDTTLRQKSGAIAPEAAPGHLVLSAGGDKKLLRIRSEAGTAEIGTPRQLPKPKLTDDTATYESAYGKGVDLRVTATGTGFRQEIVIHERPKEPVAFRIPVDLPTGMSYATTESGQPALFGKDGKKIADLRPVPMLDAEAADPAGSLDEARTGKASVTLDEDGSALILTPDSAFLSDPAVRYPITLTAASPGWVGASLTDDTFINSVDLQDGWYNSDLDRTLVGKSNSGTKTWRTYLKFKVAVSELEDVAIHNADLMLWNYLSNTCGSAVGSGIVARRITSPWDIYTLTWSNQPSTTSEFQVINNAAYSSDCSWGEGELLYSVEDTVRAWAAKLDPEYGFQLRATSESDATNWRRYRSKEGGSWDREPNHAPILFIDYTPNDRVAIHFAESGPRRTEPISYAEAVSLAQESDEDVTPLSGLTEEQLLQQDAQGGDPFPVDRSNRQPLPGESWDPDEAEQEMDEFAPKVTAVSPPNKSVEVDTGTTVSATFDEPVTGARITLKDPAGTDVAGTTAMDGASETITFTPSSPLAPGVTYKAEVSEATDDAYNKVEPQPWVFTTAGGVAAHWPFDEGSGTTSADASGHGHDATLSGTGRWIDGKTGHGVSNTALTPTRIVASKEAVRLGKAVEVHAETTATSLTYAQPDGKTYKTEVTAGPVRARQGGGWVPIDTTLVEQGGKLRTKTLAEGAVVEISAGGTDAFVKMTADGKSYALRWPTPLPKPTVKGSVATYTDAAGAGADLVVTALPDGFRHEVVLRQRPSKPLKLRIGVEDEGLTLSEGKNGRLLLKGKNQKLVAAAAPAAAWDSAKGRPARRGAAASDLVTKDGRTELVIEPDQAFLADAGTAYPVSVAAAVTLPGMTDVWISNYGTPGYSTYRNTTLWVGTYDEGEPAPWVERAFLKFDTAALANTNVSAATLSMRRTDAIGCGDARSGIKAQRVTAAWTDVELTWENQPGTATAGEAVANDSATCGAPGTMSWNLAAMAQAWASGSANHGLMLRGVDETLDGGRPPYDRAFDSFNATNKPTLTVTYTLGSTPTVAGLQISPATSAGGTVTATSLTPQLAATVADTAGGNLTGQFEIEHDPAATAQGSGQIWAGTSPAVSSGGQATVSVPAGKLADGWKIRWRARAANAATSSASAWSDWQTATVDVPNPTTGAFQVTPSQVVNGVTTATSLTPALRATVTDPAAQPLRAEFEVEHDPAASGQGTGQIWTGATDNVTSGTQATATVPDGKLTDGWKVRWRVRAINTATTVGSPWSDWQNLTIDVPDAVSEPAVGALQVSPSEQVDGVTVTPTRTPALLIQVSDPAGKPLRAEVEIEHDPAVPDQGSGQIWTGSADNVPAGTQANITVPADTLTDGWKVRWRARSVSATAASTWSDWQSFTVTLPRPTATGLAVTPSKVVDGVTVTTRLTPTLQATLTHPTGQALRAEAEIEHDPAATGQGTGRIWAGAVDNIASGTQASITVPAGTLTDGWKLRWRLRAVTDDASSVWSDWQQVTVDVTQPGEEPLAQTAGPVIRTDQSFTTAAWLRWSDKDGDYTILEQKGAHQAPFRLGNTPQHGLVFTFTSADAVGATVEGVLSGVEPPVGEWFHLAGVYDATAKTASLYLNGSLVTTAPVTLTAWNANAPMTLGSTMQGDLDDVRVYPRPLSAEQIGAMSGSTPVARPSSEPTASPKSATQAATFNYHHKSLEDCEADRDARTGKGTKVRAWDHATPYSACWSRHEYFMMFETKVKSTKQNGTVKQTKVATPEVDGQLHFDATMVMHTYLGQRYGGIVGGGSVTAQNIKVFTKISNMDGGAGEGVAGWFECLFGGCEGKFDEDDLERVLTLTVDVQGGSNACTLVPGSGYQGTLKRVDSVDDWVEDGRDEFLLRSHANPVSSCTVRPWITFNDPTPFVSGSQSVALWGPPGSVSDATSASMAKRANSPAATCDDITTWESKGGCIINGSSRIYEMALNDPTFGAVSQHINRAFTTPDDTKPPKDGKIIPGNWGLTPQGTLRETPLGESLQRIQKFNNQGKPTEKYKANLDAKDAVCTQYFSDRPRPSTEEDETKHQDCDEFPFASTDKGGGYVHPQHGWGNFSVEALNAKQNQEAGTDLLIFFSRYRVRVGHSYWLVIKP
ncbi:DNRLRE domain-containing protein [Nonomuraea sp. AD125B]|uniref:DNRLRE domain-containing protein n=1 Tax=Nonomuraea sp. AD125B TaxID=3242897 RepID=UPI0035282EFA